MPSDWIWLGIVVLVALIFDYINGFHDTANAIATSVSTKALSPQRAVMVAAVLNFVGALSGTAVASTVGKGIVLPQDITQEVVVAGLLGAICWNLITWLSGIPSSSSHALIGGIVGAAVAGFGFGSLIWEGLEKIILVLIISPVVGLISGYVIMSILFFVFRRGSPMRVNEIFRRLQVFSACTMSFSHGSNDAQKSMGIITMALVSGGVLTEFHVPLWVILSCATAMALGTAAGGWRIIKTMGGKIFKLEPINGFAADLNSSLVILTASHLGMPVSTTHVVSTSIMGVGTAKRIKAVRWGTARSIVMAWILTIPLSAVISAFLYKIIMLIV
ncbi:MAG: inorganic phosphate transporter [Syntrophomonadaceae bacterium]|nr:inorganic phosphate transporter [Syntrophomonadaceae bacterium]